MIWRDEAYEEVEMPHKGVPQKDSLLVLILVAVVAFICLLLFWYFYKL